MKRRIEAGGRQGRDPQPKADRMVDALAVAAHIADATPGLKLNPRNRWGGNLVAWWLVTDARRRAMQGEGRPA